MKSANQPDNNFDPLLPASMEEQQLQFAAHIRDPQNQPLPEQTEDRRMAIYRELFYNNIEGFVSGNFPVIRQLFNDSDWHQLVRGFFRDYRSQTPLFTEIPQEFINYLEQHKPCPEKPFLVELAHYEWVELALDLDTASVDMELLDEAGDLLSGIPVLSPHAWLLNYQWPVDKIRPDHQPVQLPEQQTYILVDRTPAEKIRFTRLNPVSARLLELLGNDQLLTGKQCLDLIATELARKDDPLVLETGQALLVNFKRQQIILGTRKS